MKTLRLIFILFILISGALSFIARDRFENRKTVLQKALDVSILNAAQMRDVTLEHRNAIVKDTLSNTLGNEADYEFLSVLSDDDTYTITIVSDFDSSFPRIFGYLPQNITTTTGVNIRNDNLYGADGLVLVNVKSIAASQMKDVFQKQPNSILVNKVDMLNLIDNSTKELMVIITDDISDPNLCRTVKLRKYDTDLIYIGEKNSSVDMFFSECIKPHPEHACLQSFHVSPDLEVAARLLSAIRSNYGIMRVTC